MDFDVADAEERNLAMNLAFNDRFQNEQLPPMLQTQIEMGDDVEYIFNDETFGLTPDNPVPVNGQLGQLAYLSLLRSPEGHGFLFQRLGSEGGIDAYEILSFDGEHRHVVYLDMYHPRRSRKAIEGMSLHTKPSAFTGVPFSVDNFPYGITDALPERATLRGLAFATAEQLESALNTIRLKSMMDALLEETRNDRGFIIQPAPRFSDFLPPVNEPDEADVSGSSLESEPTPMAHEPIKKLPGGQLDISDDDIIFDGTWEAVISASDIAAAREPRGIMVATETDAEEVFPGEYYGWYPSKALAKRARLEPDQLYDPITVLVEQAHAAYCELLPDTGGEYIPYPHRLIFDDYGFATEYTIGFGDLGMAKDFVKFVAGYWAPHRNYFVETTWYEIPAQYADSGQLEVRVIFRWSSVMDESLCKIREVVAKSEPKCLAPFSITPRGNLILNKRRAANVCVHCGSSGEVWVKPEMAEQISAWMQGRLEKLPPGLTDSERETLLTGTHPWCWAEIHAN